MESKPGPAPRGGEARTGADPTPHRRTGALARFVARNQIALLVAFGVLVAIAAVLLSSALRPLPKLMTEAEFNAAVARALQGQPPKPSDASMAYQIVRPSLVTVTATSPEGSRKTEESIGAGVVIQNNGTILTALHVVEGAGQVEVIFADGFQSDADVVVRQPENDLAVLRAAVVPDDLQPATLGNSGALQPGDEVVVVANPYGLIDSVSDGVVSGLGREYTPPRGGPTVKDLIQFDAAVNPGNSGGPLVDRSGEVVGIVTGLLNPTGQRVFVGIGFAVPIETAAAAAGSPWW